MLNRLTVFNGDSINRYGYKFTIESLVSAIEESYSLGRPMFIGHDHHRLIGWTKPLCVYLEPKLARLVGIIQSPESTEDNELVDKLYKVFRSELMREMVEPYIPKLKELLGANLIGDEKFLYASSASVCSPGLAKRAFKDLFENTDKDGLVEIHKLRQLDHGVFEVGELLIFASECFRRSISRHNTFNSELLDTIGTIDSSKNSVKIKLDEDMIGLKSTYKHSIELAYWWGPKFNDDLSLIPPGITRHEANEYQKLYSGISRTEFWWHEQDGLKTLECEEVLDIPSYGLGADAFGCRYLHSIIYPLPGNSIHIDGAIRKYDELKMLERLDKPISEAGRHTEYTKYWRIDGDISIEQWKELLTHNFRDNSLVGEYLGGVDENPFNTPQIVNTEGPPIFKYIPSRMTEICGVRASIAIFNLPPEETRMDFVEILDTIGDDSTRIPYVECDAIEPIKILRAKGLNLSIPKNVARVAFNDMYTNFPPILFFGENSLKKCDSLYNAYRQGIDMHNTKQNDRCVSFTIGFECGDSLVYLSLCGHVKPLGEFLNITKDWIFSKIDDISGWAGRIYDDVNKSSDIEPDTPGINNVLQISGILKFKRIPLPSGSYRYDKNSESWEMAFKKEDNWIYEAMASKEIEVSETFIIKKSTCSICGSEYEECVCSKFINKKLYRNMEQLDFIGLNYTDKRA